MNKRSLCGRSITFQLEQHERLASIFSSARSLSRTQGEDRLIDGCWGSTPFLEWLSLGTASRSLSSAQWTLAGRCRQMNLCIFRGYLSLAELLIDVGNSFPRGMFKSRDRLRGEKIPSPPSGSAQQTQPLPVITRPSPEVTLHAAPKFHERDSFHLHFNPVHHSFSRMELE